jgi:hypothetical protein
VDDFGALNDALPDPEPTLAEAATGVDLEPALETAAPAPAVAGEGLPPTVTEGAPDAPAGAVPSAEGPAAEAAETTAEAVEAGAAAGSSQVA